MPWAERRPPSAGRGWQFEFASGQQIGALSSERLGEQAELQDDVVSRGGRLLHMLAGSDTAAVTDQGGVPGPWHERLPHFRMAFTPSRGEELQSEYLVPRPRAAEAIEALRSLAGRFAPLLQVSEVRTVAADPLWLSGAYETDVVALHFTWVRDVPAVYAVLPMIEAALLPLGARPHWGKCFAATAAELGPLYPRFDDFRDLAARSDPDGVFRTDFLARTLDLH